MSKGGKGKKRSDDGQIPRITKTVKVVLAGTDGTRLPMGDFTLTEPEPGPTIAQFADDAFKFARASLSRLMTPQYRLIVIDGEVEQGFGLDRWIKLYDGREEEKRRLDGKGGKMSIRKKVIA